MAENWNQEIERLRTELEAEKAKVAILRRAIIKHQCRPFNSDHPALVKALADTGNKEQ